MGSAIVKTYKKPSQKKWNQKNFIKIRKDMMYTQIQSIWKIDSMKSRNEKFQRKRSSIYSRLEFFMDNPAHIKYLLLRFLVRDSKSSPSFHMLKIAITRLWICNTKKVTHTRCSARHYYARIYDYIIALLSAIATTNSVNLSSMHRIWSNKRIRQCLVHKLIVVYLCRLAVAYWLRATCGKKATTTKNHYL